MPIKCDKKNCGSTDVEMIKAEPILPFGAMTAAQANERKEVRLYLCKTCKFEFSMLVDANRPNFSEEFEKPNEPLSAEELREAMKLLTEPDEPKPISPVQQAIENSEQIVEEAGVNPVCYNCGKGRYQYNGIRHNLVPPTFQFECSNCGNRASLEPNYR